VKLAALAGVLALIGAASAGAEEGEVQGERAEEGEGDLLERAGITGSLRTGYWSSTRDLDETTPLGAGMLWLKATGQLSSRLSYQFEGWAALRGPADDAKHRAEAREAFLDLRLGPLDVRVGRQIIVWGRADGLNPTDNLNAKDFTLLTPDEDDQRIGTTAVRASYYLGDIGLTGVWSPEFRPHRFPLPRMQGVTVDHDFQSWPGHQWAARVEQTGRAVDWSVSYAYGFDLTPDLGPPAVRLTHRRVHVFGADMAASVGRFGLRAEGAYVGTEDSSGSDPYAKNRHLFVVAGADRTFLETLNLNVQYLYRYVFDHRPLVQEAIAIQQAIVSSQTRRSQHGASFRVAQRWLHDTLEAECAAAAWIDPGGYTVRPRVTYAVSDHWKVIAGGELFRGEAASLFGLLRDNSTVFIEARWSF
jgi:hypothetical protein